MNAPTRPRPRLVPLLAAGAFLVAAAATLVAAAATLVAAAATAETRWLHVHVVEDDEGSEVTVNLPLSLVEAAVAMIPSEVSDEVRVELNHAGIDVVELREMWEELRSSPDATYVTVESEDETVKVRKEGDYFVARTVERGPRGAKVDVRFPIEVIDALFSGQRDQLDFAAAIRALARYQGEMVTVEEEQTRVRVWVDEKNETE